MVLDIGQCIVMHSAILIIRMLLKKTTSNSQNLTPIKTLKEIQISGALFGH